MASIYLGNLSWGLDEEALGAAIGETAEAASLEIKRNKYGKSLGYAIASFDSAEDAQAVIAALHGAELDGREVNCREDRGARTKPAPQQQQAAAAPAATNRVFVGNLSWDTTDDILVSVFDQYNVVSAQVQHQPSGASKGWALVEFGTTEDASRAIEDLNGAELDGRDILCRVDRGTPNRTRNNNTARNNNNDGGNRRQRQPKQQRPPREPLPEGLPSANIFMGNLSWEVNNDGLDELLNGFDIEEANVQTRPDGKSRGYALVRCASLEEAQRAIEELHGQDMMGRPLVVKFDAK